MVDLISPSEAPIKHSDRPEPMDVNLNDWVEMVRDREADGSVEDGSREVVRIEEESNKVIFSLPQPHHSSVLYETCHNVHPIVRSLQKKCLTQHQVNNP